MDSTILSTASRTIRRVWRHAWATGATRVESAAVLRLVAASITAGVPVAPILDAWAEDSRGGQGTRLERAARLLRRGATASEAVTRVPGLVQEDHAVALAFGERLGIVGPVVRAALAGDELLDATARRELRCVLGYLVVVVAVLFLTSTFLAVKILPMFTKLLDDMQTRRPAVLEHWLAFAGAVGEWLWLPACLAAVAAVVACSPAARLAVMRPFTRSRRITAALAACQSDRRVATMLARVPGATPLGRRLMAAGLVDEAGGVAIDAGASDPAIVLHAIAATRRDRGSRRRMKAGRVVGPVIVLAVGAIVLFQSLAVFVPLMDIIHALL